MLQDCLGDEYLSSLHILVSLVDITSKENTSNDITSKENTSHEVTEGAAAPRPAPTQMDELLATG